MTRAALVAGASLQQARNRMLASGLWLPRLLTDGSAGASSDRAGISIQSGVANTLGAWVQVVASLSADVGFVHIAHNDVISGSAADFSSLLDIGVGAAGAEVVVLNALGVGWVGTDTIATPTHPFVHPGWLFPLWIPRASRVAIRVQCKTASTFENFRLHFFAPVEGAKPSNSIVTMGADAANSRGTVLTNPAANNTEGAWTQITAATAEPFAALGIAIQGGGDNTQTGGQALVDIGVGAAGAEVVIVENLHLEIDSAEKLFMFSPLVHPVSVPKGSRLAVRWQGSAFSGSTLDAILYGIRAAA